MVPIELFFENYDNLQALTLNIFSNISSSNCKEQLDKIKTVLPSGKIPLKISFTENNQKLTVFTKQKVRCSLENLVKLQAECGVDISVEV